MLNIKNQSGFILSLALVAAITGCMPAGPRAVLTARRLMEEGRYTEAVEKLTFAVSAPPVSRNAIVWNDLGIACQYAGQATNAAAAYQQALALDHDLIQVHYNLGCLWLEQGRLDMARSEFTAYTLRVGNSVDGWLKLGVTQLRLRDWAGAEKSFTQARQLDSQNAEALSDLGVVQLQRNRPRDAAQSFNAALKERPDYGPALLNLAVVSQTHLNNRSFALQKYRQYLELPGRPPNWDSVAAIARALELELNPASARTPAPGGPSGIATQPAAGSPSVSAASSYPRYHYRSPSKPRAGDAAASTRVFQQGVQSQESNHLPDAIQAYRRATQLDPANFNAYYNLAIASTLAGNSQQALIAYEMALAIQPASADARYNFARLLMQANYPVDAANELEKLAADDVRDGRAQLALGNVYAQQLGQPAKAREHYERFLDAEPRSPQAPAVRQWLAANPL